MCLRAPRLSSAITRLKRRRLPLSFSVLESIKISRRYVSPSCVFDNTGLVINARVQTYLSNVLKGCRWLSKANTQCKCRYESDTAVSVNVTTCNSASVAYLHCSKLITLVCFSTLLYLKFFLLWAMVILADFILEFRFEFLWPFWLLLRSVYDSFKYQGLVSVDVTRARHWIGCCRILCEFSLSLFSISLLSVSFRPSLYFLFVLHLRQTWFASFSSLCIGCFLLPALMFGCNTSGTQVCG